MPGSRPYGGVCDPSDTAFSGSCVKPVSIRYPTPVSLRTYRAAADQVRGGETDAERLSANLRGIVPGAYSVRPRTNRFS